MNVKPMCKRFGFTTDVVTYEPTVEEKRAWAIRLESDMTKSAMGTEPDITKLLDTYDYVECMRKLCSYRLMTQTQEPYATLYGLGWLTPRGIYIRVEDKEVLERAYSSRSLAQKYVRVCNLNFKIRQRMSGYHYMAKGSSLKVSNAEKGAGKFGEERAGILANIEKEFSPLLKLGLG